MGAGLGDVAANIGGTGPAMQQQLDRLGQLFQQARQSQLQQQALQQRASERAEDRAERRAVREQEIGFQRERIAEREARDKTDRERRIRERKEDAARRASERKADRAFRREMAKLVAQRPRRGTDPSLVESRKQEILAKRIRALQGSLRELDEAIALESEVADDSFAEVLPFGITRAEVAAARKRRAALEKERQQLLSAHQQLSSQAAGIQIERGDAEETATDKAARLKKDLDL